MKRFSFFLLFVGISLFVFRLTMTFSFDETALATQVVPAAPARWMSRSRDELKLLGERLSELRELPGVLYESVSPDDYGRQRLFLPDQKKKVLSPLSTEAPTS